MVHLSALPFELVHIELLFIIAWHRKIINKSVLYFFIFGSQISDAI